ncbi:carbohydrate ABC transporter permease [Butyrivibrio sp. MC2013]|uniref:carbohydrate ABC transporter permease n=1 Tax=Butyrivibrio sp. MC2013 TaxID=1280686 RepID=UPI00047CB911|nr:sugar ABC transporter permease [Butyrivibrio sp. MC2013]
MEAERSKKSLFYLLLEDIMSRLSVTWKEVKKAKVSYAFIAPFCLIFIIFYLVPVLVSIGLSFTYYNILEAPRFIGWQNYINLFFADDVFLIAVKNTFLFAVITGPLGYFAALMIAWMINEIKNRFIRALMTLAFYAPTISGQAFIIWKFIFSSDGYGLVNGWLMKLGITYEPILWFEDAGYIQPILIIVVLWMSMGTGFLSFIAGLQNVDNSLYEAGYIDGVRNRFQELWYITLPSMKPQLMFGAVMTITSSFAIHDQLAALAGFPSVDYQAHTVVSHLIDYGSIRFEMGYASSIATLLFFTMILCNKLVQRLIRKVGD